MSNIEKRKAFSPVDAKRLVQQNNTRPSKGHRRGKVSGGTSKANSSKDESISLASLLDDTGFDFLTNPKPDATIKPIQREASTFWSSTSKTPKISNVTLATLQAERSGKPNHGSTSIPAVQQVDAKNKASGKPPKPHAKPMPPPKPRVNPPTKSTPQHSVRSLPMRFPDPSNKPRTIIPLLETIMEGTPEQERESPPLTPPVPMALEKGFATHPPLQSKGASLDDSNKLQISSDLGQRKNQLDDEASAHASDMDESSDDNLMNLTLSPPMTQEQTESHHYMNRNEPPAPKGKTPRSENLQPRLHSGERPAPSSHFIDQNQRERMEQNHFHSPRANQNIMQQSTPYPAASMMIQPPRPPERQRQWTKLETNRQIVKVPSFQEVNVTRNVDESPSANENTAVDISIIQRHKDPDGGFKSKTETIFASENVQERSRREMTSNEQSLIIPLQYNGVVTDPPSTKRPTKEGSTTQAAKNHRIRENERSDIQQNLPTKPDHKPKLPKRQDTSIQDYIEADGPNNHTTNYHERSKRIVHGASAVETKNSYQNTKLSNDPNCDINNGAAARSTVDILGRKTGKKHTDNTKSKDVNMSGDRTPLNSAVQQTDTKHNSVEPINKEVWRAMMARPDESKKDTSGFLGLVIETPAQGFEQDDSESIDGSELTQDTFFLLDRAYHLNLQQSRTLQPTSLMRRKPACGPDLQPKQTGTHFQTITHTTTKENAKKGTIDLEANQNSPQMQCQPPSLRADPDNGDNLAMKLSDEKDKPRETKENVRTNNPFEYPTVQFSTPLPNFSTKSAVPDIKHNLTAKLSNEKEKPQNAKEHGSTNNPFAQKNSTVQCSTPFPNVTTRLPVDFIGTCSSSGRQLLQIRHDDVYSAPVSTVTKTAVPKGLQPTLWTSEIAGSKVKALGVNAAPVFRLDPGKYFRHAPLPPGWTIAVSRSHNMPFYIHPDFGATFYSPVPLPSSDGDVQGTTLLYQADTPEYHKQEDALSGSQAASTPIIFGLTQPVQSTEKTSSGATQQCMEVVKETPIGALLVATNDQFSEMNFGEKPSNGLHEVPQLEPLESPLHENLQTGEPFSPATESVSQEEGHSNDSATTATIACSQKFRKGGIPTEIEILHQDNAADDDKFQMNLDATAEHERNILPSNSFPGTSPEKKSCNIEPENKSAESDSKSSASIGSNDASLDWAAGISLNSTASEVSYPSEEMILFNQNRSDPTTPPTYSKNGTDGPSTQRIRKSGDSPESENILYTVDDYEHSPSIPQRVIVGIDFDGDDMSRLPCTPQQYEHTATTSSRFEPIPAPLRTNLSDATSILTDKREQDDNDYEEPGRYFSASRSYASIQSGLSIASRRSLHPLLPLCSLQTLQFVKVRRKSEKKRKKERKMKQVKRQRTVQTIPISA